MPKKGVPLSPEAREKLSQQAKAKWAAKKSQQDSITPEAKEAYAEADKILGEWADRAEWDEAHPKPIKQQSRAVQARWAGERATEEEIEAHFRSLPLEKAFALYDKLKKNFELAGRILAERANQPEVQKCETCGVTWDEFVKTSRKPDWFLNRPHYMEGNRNVILVDHYCSAACVSYANNKTQGVRGIPDRGMVPGDNPKNHPRSNSPSQFHDKAI